MAGLRVGLAYGAVGGGQGRDFEEWVVFEKRDEALAD